MKTIENHGFTISKKSVFFFALFLSFFHRQTHRPTANSARSLWPSLPGRVEPSSFTSRSWRNCLPCFFWGKLIFFVVPEIHAVYWKIDFVNFLLGEIFFTRISQNGRDFIHLSVFFLAMFQTQGRAEASLKKHRRGIMNRLGVTNLTNQGVSWTL